MGEPLQQSPLVEAICQFNFAALEGSDWDLTIPGRLYDLVKDEFPNQSQIREVNIQLQTPTSGQPQLSQSIKGTDRVQLKRSDDSAMVQVGPNLLAINHLRPYQSWNIFCSLIIRVFGQYVSLFDGFVLERIGLRYINNIHIPDEKIEISDFVTTEPNLSGSLDRPLSFFHQRYDLNYNDLSAVLIHQTAIINRNSRAFLALDLDFSSVQVGNYNEISGIESWLNTAHKHIGDAFVSSLNSAYYNSIK